MRCALHEARWGCKTGPEADWQYESFAPLERDDYFTAQEHAYLDAVEGKAPPLCTVQEGQQTLRVSLAALASADSAAGWVKVR